jgi:hypothetical protein
MAEIQYNQPLEVQHRDINVGKKAKLHTSTADAG